MVLTDLDGLNPSLIGSTRVSLQQAGFSGPTLDKLKESFAEKTYHKGSEAFLSALASYLVDPDPEKLLTKRIIFVVGSSGTGRTTMTAKLVAVLRESHPNKEIVAATLFGQAAGSTTSLQSFGRLLNIPVCSLDLLTPASDFDKMTDYDTMIIDVVACPEEAVKKIKDIKAHVGDKDLATVITIPGSTSSAMINLTMEISRCSPHGGLD